MDTTKRNLIFLNGDSSVTANKILPQKSGNKILLSTINKNFTKPEHSLITKIDVAGNILWSKEIINNADSTIRLLDAIELSDGTMAVYGSSVKPHPSQIIKHLLIRLDGSGSIVSYNPFFVNTPVEAKDVQSVHLCELENKELGLLINLFAQVVDALFFVGRFSSTNNLVWGKCWYSNTHNYDALGIVKVGNTLMMPAKFHSYSNAVCDPNVRKGAAVMKLNSFTGDVLASKSYCYPKGDPTSFLTGTSSISYASDGLLRVFSDNTDRNAASIININYDTLLNAVSSKAILNRVCSEII